MTITRRPLPSQTTLGRELYLFYQSLETLESCKNFSTPYKEKINYHSLEKFWKVLIFSKLENKLFLNNYHEKNMFPHMHTMHWIHPICKICIDFITYIELITPYHSSYNLNSSNSSHASISSHASDHPVQKIYHQNIYFLNSSIVYNHFNLSISYFILFVKFIPVVECIPFIKIHSLLMIYHIDDWIKPI